MTASKMTAAQRVAFAREYAARIGADAETTAHLVRAARQTSRGLGLAKDTPKAAAKREAERRARIQAVIDQMGA